MTKRACLGTKEIRLAIGRKGDSVEENGMLLLFRPTTDSRTMHVPVDDVENGCASTEHQREHSVEEGNNPLDVMVTNGSITFRG